MIQIKFPPFSAKSVHPPVNLPLPWRYQLDSQRDRQENSSKERVYGARSVGGVVDRNEQAMELCRRAGSADLKKAIDILQELVGEEGDVVKLDE
jgi:hypothetical protein